MTTQTYLYIILAGVTALLAALFLYKYKSKSALKHNALFAFLRFLSVFLILLLLINPQIENTSYYNEKPNLVLVTDNSNSIQQLKQQNKTLALTNNIATNKALNERFNVVSYSFNNQLSTDSLNFKSKQTNISKALNDLKQIYKNTVSPTILITDGNQTVGSDYQYSAKNYKQNIYPITVGDTTVYDDIKLSTLNVNKYAYLKNKFPVEAIVNYNGDAKVTKQFSVSVKGKVVYKKALAFTKAENSQVLRFELPTTKVGVQTYVAHISTLDNEKNTKNNTKNFAIEVVDDSTKVAIVSTLLHPDLGVLKKAIESNKQRKAVILKPNELKNQINTFQLVILYQPNNQFNYVFQLLKKENTNTFTITGTKTDWDFLNKSNNLFDLEATNQTEDYQANLNTGYSSFIVQDLDFNSFPPLKSTFGTLELKDNYQSLLYKSVNGISTQEPLLATFEINSQRHAVLFGENLWKWRSQSFINKQSFGSFDDFVGKLVQYLASKQRKQRLTLDYNSFYDGATNATLNAQAFNKNYEFDANQNLSIVIKDKVSKETTTLPLILNNSYYQVDLSTLKPSKYSFTVSSNTEKLSKSGQFEILDYNIEAQFTNANVTKLRQVATDSKGEVFFTENYENLITKLSEDKRYLPIQKSTTKTESLIDWYYILFLITLIIAIEWFLRKYKGLI